MASYPYKPKNKYKRLHTTIYIVVLTIMIHILLDLFGFYEKTYYGGYIKHWFTKWLPYYYYVYIGQTCFGIVVCYFVLPWLYRFYFHDEWPFKKLWNYLKDCSKLAHKVDRRCDRLNERDRNRYQQIEELAQKISKVQTQADVLANVLGVNIKDAPIDGESEITGGDL